MAKGVAIVLVVAGHTLQGSTPDFDELPAFRFIYAFHMPLFAFLAGASAATWWPALWGVPSIVQRGRMALSRVGRAAVHLLLPFIAWTLIGWWHHGQAEPLGDHLLRVVRQPDVSLWFLPCIFWCIAYCCLGGWLLAPIASWMHRRAAWLRDHVSLLVLQAVLLALCWSVLRARLPGYGGFVFANQFHGGLFLFYLLGLVLFRPFGTTRRVAVRWLPLLVFAALVPFWHRTLPNDLVADAPARLADTGALRNRYALVVAVCGTLAAVEVTRWLAAIPARPLHRALAYLGQASLAIYASHFYFLGVRPLLVSPLAISTALYAVVSRIPLVRVVLLGVTPPSRQQPSVASGVPGEHTAARP